MVQAITGSTARATDNIEDFKTALFGRIQSLAKTHLLLSDEERAVKFRSTFCAANLMPSTTAPANASSLRGPDVPLISQLAVSLGMAIHELTANAAKYGALSVYGGKVEVTWSVTIDATRRILMFDWVESGGPPCRATVAAGIWLEAAGLGIARRRFRPEAARNLLHTGCVVHCELPLPTVDLRRRWRADL